MQTANFTILIIIPQPLKSNEMEKLLKFAKFDDYDELPSSSISFNPFNSMIASFVHRKQLEQYNHIQSVCNEYLGPWFFTTFEKISCIFYVFVFFFF